MELNSKEKLDSFVGELKPLLPAGVCLREYSPINLHDRTPQYLRLRSRVGTAPPNPIGIELDLHSGYDPFVVAVELYVKVDADEHLGWLYAVSFVVDDLLTKDEVCQKVLQAAALLAGYRDRKFQYDDLPVDTAGRRLDEDDTGEVHPEES